MKKILTFVLAVCLIIPVSLGLVACDKDKEDTWNGKTVEVSAEKNGVITIDSAEELAGLAKAVNEGNSFEGKKIELTCDIDLRNKEWTPIGYGSSNYLGAADANSAVFRGEFNGKGHTIENLKITAFRGGSANTNSATGIGLFGAIVNATIKNLKIEDAIVTGNHFVAAAVGQARGSVIDNVHVEDARISCEYLDEDESGDKAGVVVAYSGVTTANNGSVTYCTAEDSTVNAARDAGQIIGCLAIDYTGADQKVSTQTGNVADEVVVTDNNGVQNTDNNDNIKNDVVGRIHDARV